MTHLVGLGTYRDSDGGKTGVRFTIPLSPRWSLSGDGGVADDFSRAVVAKRFNGRVGFDAGNGFRLSAGVELADRLKPAFVLGISKGL